MAEISKIILPSGNTYDLKDAYARELIAGGVTFIVAWDGTTTPVVANIPAGVVVTYNDTDYTGTLSTADAQAGAFYLVKSTTAVGTLDVYDEYSVVGPSGSRAWEKLGDTQLDLSNLGALAYKDNVTLSKGSGDNVLGEATTFTAAASSVSFGAHTTDKCLGSDATFTTTVTPTTTNIKATASGGGAAWNSKDTKTVLTGVQVTAQPTVALETGATAGDGVISVATGITSASASFSSTDSKTCLTGVSASKKKLTTTSVPNVTSAGSASSWSFSMGSGTDAETLIISGANGSAPTIGTAITCATGGLSETSETSNVGGTVAIDASSSGTATVVGTSATLSASVTPTTTNIKATASGTTVGSSGTASVIGSSSTFTNTQPTVSLSTGATAGTGVISVATGITSATTAADAKDEVTALTALGAGTAAAQSITVGTNDKVKVAKYNDLGVTVS